MVLETLIAGIIAYFGPAVANFTSAVAGIFQAMIALLQLMYTIAHDTYKEIMEFRNSQPVFYLMAVMFLLAIFLYFDGEWHLTDGLADPQALGLSPTGTLFNTQVDLPSACNPSWQGQWDDSSLWSGGWSPGGGNGFGGGGGGFR